MFQTKSQNPNSIVLSSAKIEITHEKPVIDEVKTTWSLEGLFDLGLARGIKITGSSSKIEIKADNGIVPLSGKIDQKMRVEFLLLERHIPFLGKAMKGLVSVSTLPGEKKSVKETLSANTKEKNKAYEFLHTNFDASEPKNIFIKQGQTTIAASDYTIAQGANGMYTYLFKTSSSFDVAKESTIEYEITPIKAYRLGYGSGGVAEHLAMRLTNKRKADDGRTITRTFDLPYGIFDADYSVGFKAESDGDNAAEVPMAFEFSPYPDLELSAHESFVKTSLIKEEQEV